jgi:quaternary ammonium compound-resistance protein SugE
MAWVILIIAGLFETAMAISLKYAEGFTRLWPSLAFAVTGGLSFFLLSQALKSLPVGTAYAVWTGIGAAGTAIIGMVLLGETREVAKILSLTALIAGIVGLQLTSGGH